MRCDIQYIVYARFHIRNIYIHSICMKGQHQWHIYTVEQHSTTGKKDILSFATTWIDSEHIMLSEINQIQVLYDITYIWTLKKSNL